ncbi:MAG: DUF481 domain-containing protein [Endomicrobiales bacterium]|nr:DUF481 domain-containing protein [Endomicrobiales bacterium]
MKKLILLFGFVFAFPPPACCGDTVLKGMFGATFTQTGVSDNWSGQEKNSKSWGLKLDASAVRKYLKTEWSNTLKEEYGKSEISGSPEQVSLDLIDFNSVFTYKASVYANPYVSFLVTTVHDTFHDPVTYRESAGVGWAFIDREKHHLKLRTGFAYDQKFGSKIGAVRETGAEGVFNYDIVLSETSKFVSEARYFTAFKSDSNLRWDSSFYAKLSQYVTLALNYLEIFNSTPDAKREWPTEIETRFTVTLGLSYNLF